MSHLFCFGLGYSGQVIGNLLQAQGWKVSGTTRDITSKVRLEQDGFTMHLFDDDHHISPDILNDVSHVLLSIPPGEAGDLVFLQYGNELAARAENIEWVGYLSTTGVYGDRQGEWVDENSPLTPSTKRGEKRLKAETDWLSLYESNNLPVHLFRLAGIYGPDSNQLEKVAAGTAKRRRKPGQVFSRIHVEDIAGIVIASMKKPNPGQAYNVCDDEAAPPQDVVTFAAHLLNMEPPPEVMFDPKDMSAMGLSFFAESKRVSNEKVKSELGYVFKYPTYREGLKALLPTVTHTVTHRA